MAIFSAPAMLLLAVALVGWAPITTTAVLMPSLASFVQNIANPGYCLQVNGANLSVAPCDLEALEQAIDMTQVGQVTTGYVKFFVNDKYLEIVGAGTSNGDSIGFSALDWSDNQKWTMVNGVFDGAYQLKNIHSNKCLTMEGVAGVNQYLDQWDCYGQTYAPHQTWRTVWYPRFTAPDWTMMLKSVVNGNCLDNFGGNQNNGAQVGLYLCTPSAANQHWTFDLNAAQTQATIRNKASGKCLQIDGPTANGARVTQWDCATDTSNLPPDYWWTAILIDPTTQSETTRRVAFETAIAPGKALTPEWIQLYTYSDIWDYTTPIPASHQMFQYVTPALYKKPVGSLCGGPLECLSGSCSVTCQAGPSGKPCQTKADCISPSFCYNGSCIG